MQKSTCENCPFTGPRVKARGPEDADVIIIGDSPTPIELAKGAAGYGNTHKLLIEMLKGAGFTKDDKIMYMNVIRCNGGKRKKAADKKNYRQAQESCRQHIIDRIREHPRQIIITLGAGASQSLLQDYKLKITELRGVVHETDLAESGLITMVHPNTVLAGGGSLPQYRRDFKVAYELYKSKLVQKYVEPRYTVLTRKTQVKALSRILKEKGGLVGTDIETGGFDHWKDEILELGITLNGEFVYIIPEELLDPSLFENNCQFTWHNGKFDIKFLWQYDCLKARVDHDTMLMSYCMDEIKGNHDLDTTSHDWIRAPNHKHDLKPYLPNKETSYREIPEDVRRLYAARDVAKTYQQFAPMYRALKQDPDLWKNYHEVLIPASEYLARIEENGFLVDANWARSEKERMEQEMQECLDEIHEVSLEVMGIKVNPNSPQQLQKFLYSELKLGHPLQATDKDHLEKISHVPVVKALMKYRKLKKNLSTYIDPCVHKVDTEGRVHATYKLNGTVTGRLASSGPNMQNIPRLKAVRGMFIAPEGKILIECDLSQAELRSLAELSGDEVLIHIFNSDEISLHDEVTAQIFEDYTKPEVSPEEKKEMKMRGKAVNFGIVYGRQAFSFVAEFEITLQEARRWIETWLDRFPKARDFIKNCRNAVMKGQTLKTVFGRKRRFGVITRERTNKLGNEASNFPHQSTASDITLLAGVMLEPVLKKYYGAIIVNTVHDCIVIEADPKHKDEICRLVTAVMEYIPRKWGLTKVPFEAEAESGTRWGHLEEEHEFRKLPIPDIPEFRDVPLT